ncbi:MULTISPECIES: RNA polymerase sigma factor [unclassified Sphingobium]|uniref:RNA polymerase sigma factor n=1 Tax=unclassified Sphingobium TaxID=2611147 RepID=UPI000D173A01|nr:MULTISPECIES: RNA polymerase sigma factor [unclassified Sphingobium]MBG6120174.1 RNA polymerase sigma-70 factor (ECF subfamily) [Sphingobium sp. JAI105]PSO09813.1 RNA polymerase subunit sigma-70 [Sphingobium sp. AEW4]TWC97724.1 RNA polymerase sigma-70 factor (ECF subfamily) [Sphingobium sp. AEW010]TWD17808.1 RNA polymerase sigma-70 factor (ECF subfamily) [Sphingobium sp. AEW013]TWD20058.1 RNA polymerase sigma-70 factor (ECF subfamily) [Sphingobium sp. AEW001]
MGQGEREGRRIDLQITSKDSGERFSFSDFYRREKPRLLRFFNRQLGNTADADDLSQETLTRFVRAAPHPDLVSPRAYLTRIATNLLRNHAARGSTRMSRRSTELDDGVHGVSRIDPHRELQARQELAHWTAILQQLPPRTLEIFLLNRVEGFSYRQIATDLEEPLWVIQKHMLKAIRLITAHKEADND